MDRRAHLGTLDSMAITSSTSAMVDFWTIFLNTDSSTCAQDSRVYNFDLLEQRFINVRTGFPCIWFVRMSCVSAQYVSICATDVGSKCPLLLLRRENCWLTIPGEHYSRIRYRQGRLLLIFIFSKMHGIRRNPSNLFLYFIASDDPVIHGNIRPSANTLGRNLYSAYSVDKVNPATSKLR